MRVIQTPTLAGAGTPRDPLAARELCARRALGARFGQPNSDIATRRSMAGVVAPAKQVGTEREVGESAWVRDEAGKFGATKHRA
jgi:hypothetical protein